MYGNGNKSKSNDNTPGDGGNNNNNNVPKPENERNRPPGTSQGKPPQIDIQTVDNGLIPPEISPFEPPKPDIQVVRINDTADGRKPPDNNGRDPPPEVKTWRPPSLKDIPQHPWDWIITRIPTTTPLPPATPPYDIPPEHLWHPPTMTPPPGWHVSTTPLPVSVIRRTTKTDRVVSERTLAPGEHGTKTCK